MISNIWRGETFIDKTRVIQFYLDENDFTQEERSIFESFSYIFDPDTDEIEFSIHGSNIDKTILIYYTANEQKINMETGERNIAAEWTINSFAEATIIARIPAQGRLIREIYEDNSSQVSGNILPEDYNPTLGSNFYKDLNDNSYITKDTFEDYLRSNNIEGHLLDNVGRIQTTEDGYFKIIKSLRIKCNALEKSVDSNGNYYSSDREVDGYAINGIYVYDFYDLNKNLIRENVTEVTSYLNFYNIYKKELVKKPGTNIPAIRVLPFPKDDDSFNYVYAGRVYYEDFDGVLRYVQSSNYITLEKFSSIEFGEEGGTPKYWEGGYPLYILGPNAGDTITFSIQLKKDENENYPEGNVAIAKFKNIEYQRLFYFSDNENRRYNVNYDSESGKITVVITARFDNDETDPWRPSYAKILPSLETTSIKIYKNTREVYSIEIPYYVIQKSSRIGIIPKKYESEDSKIPIDLKKEEGKYILPVEGGIGLKLAYAGITSEIDPYDKNIVRNWTIREDMTYIESSTGAVKKRERYYFFKAYSGTFEEKFTLITGAYDGRLPEFYVRDYIDRSDLWRQAVYESEVTIIPEIVNSDKEVDLGGGWSYTLETDTNYFIGSYLLYLFNEDNKYKTQRFNLRFKAPPNTGPSYANFLASINDFNLLRNNEGATKTDVELGLTYTFYSNYRTIYDKLYAGGSDTYRMLTDYNDVKDTWEEIPIVYDDDHIEKEKMTLAGDNTQQLYIEVENVNGTEERLCVTTAETPFPVFFEDPEYGGELRPLRDNSNRYLYIETEETSDSTRPGYFYGKPKEGSQDIRVDCPKLTLNVENSNLRYIAYKIVRLPFVNKYTSLVEIKNSISSRKILYIAFEDIDENDNIVRFDLIYPQHIEIRTKDFERLPTQDPLKFSFRLRETGANYEYQEIRFYCGMEGIQPLKLLRQDDKIFPNNSPEGITNSGYPEVDLPFEINKFNIFSETYSDVFPDWSIVSAYNTFDYSAQNENEIVILDEENSKTFNESKSYLQVGFKDRYGGTDFIDLIRTKTGEEVWWNDWRFFVYNKFTNRYSLYSSSGSPNFLITDGDHNEIKSITLNEIGLYRLHLSLKDVNVESSTTALSMSLVGDKLINLYLVNFDPGAFVTDSSNPANVDPDKLKSGYIKRGNKINKESIQIDSQGGTKTSQVLYLWYEGGGDATGRLEFNWIIAGGGTYSKSVTLRQKRGNLSGETAKDFFDLYSYHSGSTTPITMKAPVVQDNIQLGFPIFGGVPGYIELENIRFPYGLNFEITLGDQNFLNYSSSCKIDSPSATGEGIVEKGCYIVGSFIKSIFTLKLADYDNITVNDSRKTWKFKFNDSGTGSFYGDLYYDSPFDVSEFNLNSDGSVGSYISGASSTSNFLANVRNENALYFRYAPDNIQSLVIQNAPNHLNIVDVKNLGFVKKANGSSITLTTSIDKLVNQSLSLPINSVDYRALDWKLITDHSISIQLYNDSDIENFPCTNIPLGLLNMFTDLTDTNKNVEYITTIQFRLGFTLLPPATMGKDIYETLMISESDSSYPSISQWYGLGQEFINKIEIVGDPYILPCSEDGKVDYQGKSNPGFLIPMGKFKGNQTNHTIKINSTYSINSLFTSGTYNSEYLISGVEVYSGKTSTKQKIESSISYNGGDIIINFNKKLTEDILIIPYFTNIEYCCIQDQYSEWWTNKQGNRPAYGIQAWNKGETNVGPSDPSSFGEISKNNSEEFWGFYVKGINPTLSSTTSLDISGFLKENIGFSKLLKHTLNGFNVDLKFTIDQKEESEPLTLTRRGYGNFFCIRPGKFITYNFIWKGGQLESSPNLLNEDYTGIYQLCYKFFEEEDSLEYTDNSASWEISYIGGKGTNSWEDDFNYRELYIIFPGRDNIEFSLNGLGRHFPRKTQGGDTPSANNSPFPEEALVSMSIGTLNGDEFKYISNTTGGYKIKYRKNNEIVSIDQVSRNYSILSEMEGGFFSPILDENIDSIKSLMRDLIKDGGSSYYIDDHTSPYPIGPWAEKSLENYQSGPSEVYITYGNKILYKIRFVEEDN